MLRRDLIVVLTMCAGVLSLPGATAQEPQRAADGVTLNDEGLPQYATFSLCAVDPVTGQSGAAVTTRVPFVGRAVPHVRAGVGAVCTQASTVVEYGPRGLDLLAKDVEPRAVLQQLLADDRSRESRQVGVINMKGVSAAHTGKNNSNWAGSRQGRNYTVQANTMVGPEVVEAIATSFEATEGTGLPLAERMILAVEAGQQKGGDRRWGNLQSAAIKVADPNDPGRGGDHISVAIDVGEHAEPVAEMKRIYYTTGRRLGYRSFSNIEGPDVIELKRMLHSLGYWRSGDAAIPDQPPASNTAKMRELQRTDPGQYSKLTDESRRATAEYNKQYAQYDAETMAAVDMFRTDKGLNYQGNAAGLVDARFVDALRAEYLEKRKAGSSSGVSQAAVATEDVDIAAAVAFTEGPTVDRDGNVYFTELVFGRIMKLSPTGVLSTFREHSNYANGLLIDADGRLIAAEGADSSRTGVLVKNKPQVTRTDLRTGKIEILADSYQGAPFSGPNDVTIDGKGRIYFTDLTGTAVYRIDAPGKVARILAAPDIQRPNGIQISPDDKILYLVEANGAAGGARLIRSYDLQPDGTVRNMRVHYNFSPGRSADGMSIDREGNLYASAGLHRRRGTSETLDTRCGVHVISPAGKLVKFIPIPEDTITNNAFGGADLKTLYVTAGKTLYKVRTDVAGLPR